MAAEATKIPFVEGAAAATPAASRVVVYAKADGLMYSKDDAGAETLMSSGGVGSVATDAIWDAAGDLAVGTGANTAAKLTVGASGKVPTSNGTTLAYAYPPAYEFDYVQKTADTSITSTNSASPDTIVTANAVSYDGSTAIIIEFVCDEIQAAGGSSNNFTLWLYDGSTQTGVLGVILGVDSTNFRQPVCVKRRLTPSNASHTYSIRAHCGAATWTVGANDGSGSNRGPVYIRQTKA